MSTPYESEALIGLAGRNGTRKYGTVVRKAVGATTSPTTDPIGATEVLLHASVKCYILAAETPTVSASTGIPLEAGEKFHMQIAATDKIAVIRDTADGFLHIVPVV